LLVAAATCVQLARGVLANDLSQATFICRVDLIDSVNLSKLSCTERGLTSSSFGMITKVPCFHSSITSSKPRLIASNSSSLMMPVFELALAKAIDPRRSSL
jgi:hypothetical protein